MDWEDSSDCLDLDLDVSTQISDTEFEGDLSQESDTEISELHLEGNVSYCHSSSRGQRSDTSICDELTDLNEHDNYSVDHNKNVHVSEGGNLNPSVSDVSVDLSEKSDTEYEAEFELDWHTLDYNSFVSNKHWANY